MGVIASKIRFSLHLFGGGIVVGRFGSGLGTGFFVGCGLGTGFIVGRGLGTGFIVGCGFGSGLVAGTPDVALTPLQSIKRKLSNTVFRIF